MFILINVVLLFIVIAPLLFMDKSNVREEFQTLRSMRTPYSGEEESVRVTTAFSPRFFRNDKERLAHTIDVLGSNNFKKEVQVYKDTYGDTTALAFLTAGTIRLFAARFLPSVATNMRYVASDAKFLVSFADSTVMSFEFPHVNVENVVKRDKYVFKIYPSKEEALLDGDHAVIYEKLAEDFDNDLIKNVPNVKSAGVDESFLVDNKGNVKNAYRYMQLSEEIVSYINEGISVAKVGM